MLSAYFHAQLLCSKQLYHIKHHSFCLEQSLKTYIMFSLQIFNKKIKQCYKDNQQRNRTKAYIKSAPVYAASASDVIRILDTTV